MSDRAQKELQSFRPSNQKPSLAYSFGASSRRGLQCGQCSLPPAERTQSVRTHVRACVALSGRDDAPRKRADDTSIISQGAGAHSRAGFVTDVLDGAPAPTTPLALLLQLPGCLRAATSPQGHVGGGDRRAFVEQKPSQFGNVPCVKRRTRTRRYCSVTLCRVIVCMLYVVHARTHLRSPRPAWRRRWPQSGRRCRTGGTAFFCRCARAGEGGPGEAGAQWAACVVYVDSVRRGRGGHRGVNGAGAAARTCRWYANILWTAAAWR